MTEERIQEHCDAICKCVEGEGCEYRSEIESRLRTVADEERAEGIEEMRGGLDDLPRIVPSEMSAADLWKSNDEYINLYDAQKILTESKEGEGDPIFHGSSS